MQCVILIVLIISLRQAMQFSLFIIISRMQIITIQCSFIGHGEIYRKKNTFIVVI